MTPFRFLPLLAGTLLASAALLAPATQARPAPSGPAPTANTRKNAGVQRIDPTFWWVGMKNPRLQLLVHVGNIGQSQVSLSYAGVTLNGTQKLANPNYLLINLTIGPQARPGQLTLEFRGARTIRRTYELRARTTPQDPTKVQGLTTADFV